jgi:hypothetical protein
MTMMTRADIRTELGWSDDMIHSLLQIPDLTNARRCKYTGAYTYGLYKRERVLAAAQSTEGRAAKRRWDQTVRGDTPHPGWTTRLGDIGQALGIRAAAAGKMLERLGYRFDKRVTDRAVAAGCGVRRWDGYAMHDDWPWIAWCPPSDRQSKSPANRQSLMLSRQRSLNRRQGSEWRTAGVNRRRRRPYVSKRRRP